MPEGGEGALSLFHPWVQAWFTGTFGTPTLPQELAWPAIAAGENVLVHAPTGSGKTLAAFLWAIDRLIAGNAGGSMARGSAGVDLIYVSPLKALNYDVERNLRVPIAGIGQVAARHHAPAPAISVAVRTGDTPARERAAMLRRPPRILITTPESLYLLLGSPHARRILATARTVIVDEIHAVCGTKRGAHLALSLERLERAAPGFQRIGLSATQRPLEEVARFLGGKRPVRIVDAVYDKALDLQVLGMPEPTGAAVSGSVWPELVPRVLDDIRSHRSTLIFSNSRMQAERLADRLNAESMLQDTERARDGSASQVRGVEGPFKAHHGSISERIRRQLEEDLKAGRLPALIGTSSLELGIDIGSVDLVVQVQSPKSVARGLQRVGRSGHLVGETSRGRIYGTHNEDLLEAAVVGRGMRMREIEEISVVRNPLDVLAQQVVAAVSVDDWSAHALFALCRRAYPFSGLTREAFESVLKLVSGGYASRAYRPLRARIYWDRASGLLTALPGARLHAMSNGGTIVDRGEFAVYLPDGRTRLGELDEEFVWESRVGDVFTLGSQVWRALDIQDDRVIAEPAPGALPRMPFWKGDFPWRPFDLSLKLARFRGEIAGRLSGWVDRDDDPPAVVDWLKTDYLLDDAGARQAIDYIRRQLRAAGAISSDTSVIVETYQDGVGDLRLVLHSPFGGRVNAGWAVALAGEIGDRTGVDPDIQVSDDGVMFRVPEVESGVLGGLVEGLDLAGLRERLLRHLDDSPLFGARFRQNATRALLMPVSVRGRRTPFWLQRRRARDLLSIAKEHADFPVLLETYRDCLEDALDLSAIERVLGDIASGRIRVRHLESKVPSPVARSLDYAFTNVYLYEWDSPKAERATAALRLDRAALADLLKDPAFAEYLRPEAFDEVFASATRTRPGSRARTPVELARLIEEAGDVTLAEAEQRCEGEASAWLEELERRGLAIRLPGFQGTPARQRWTTPGQLGDYAWMGPDTTAVEGPSEATIRAIVSRYLATHQPAPVGEIARRYRLPVATIDSVLSRLQADGLAISGLLTQDRGDLSWSVPELVTKVQQRTLSILRREVRPVSPYRYAAYVRRVQRIRSPASSAPGAGYDDLAPLRGLRMSLPLWNRVVLPARLGSNFAAHMDSLCRAGKIVWVACPEAGGRYSIAIFPRASGDGFVEPPDEAVHPGGPAGRIIEFLRSEGTATSADVRQALGDLSLTAVRDALSEGTAAGLVTADSWRVLSVLGERARARALSGIRGSVRRDRVAHGRSNAAKAVARAVREATAALPPEVTWSHALRHAIRGPELATERRARARIEALLARYGVVTRHAVAAEGRCWNWEELTNELSIMELRGDVRRGYFVAGLPGLQYARSETIDRLREPPDPSIILLNAADPAFVLDREMLEAGHAQAGLLAGVSRVPSTWIAFSGDSPVLVAEADGARIGAVSPSAGPEVVVGAVGMLRDAIGADGQRVTIETWNGRPAASSEGAEILAAAGFRRDYPGMTFDQVQARLLTRDRPVCVDESR